MGAHRYCSGCGRPQGAITLQMVDDARYSISNDGKHGLILCYSCGTAREDDTWVERSALIVEALLAQRKT